jgi:acetyl esterase/lipase
MDRRSLIGALAASGIPVRAAATPAGETIPLWPSTPPGGEGVNLTMRSYERSSPNDHILSSIGSPYLTVFRPETPNGAAILIVPGGGYLLEVFDLEGVVPAQFFASHGFTSFILTYRLPSEGWKGGREVSLQDAQRAMRLIRAMGPLHYGIAPDRVGVLGFSAGGHLAALLATKFETQTYAPVDDADKTDARPSFAALLYPVITMRPPYAHESSCEKLLGRDASLPLRTAYSAELLVTPNTPPSFLCVAADDPDVAIDNSFMMFGSLKAKSVGAELHTFEKGGHGFGLGDPHLPNSQWPDLFWRWGASRGYFRPQA